MRDEGYIKYEMCHMQSEPLRQNLWRMIEEWRNRLWGIGMIGVYPDGIGYGNISMRVAGTDKMMITGSGTGKMQRMNNSKYALVESVDINQNRVECRGPVPCSSEAMTHYMIYSVLAEVNAVIHVHAGELWQFLKNRAPTVPESAGYGTPEMAREVESILRDPKQREEQTIVMAGHDEGLIFFGRDIDAAGSVLLKRRGELYRAKDEGL